MIYDDPNQSGHISILSNKYDTQSEETWTAIPVMREILEETKTFEDTEEYRTHIAKLQQKDNSATIINGYKNTVSMRHARLQYNKHVETKYFSPILQELAKLSPEKKASILHFLSEDK
jgi:hypothetical protein